VTGVTATGRPVLIQATGPNPARGLAALRQDLNTAGLNGLDVRVSLIPATLVLAARGEHWWPVALAIAVVAVLHVALPAKYRVNPAWVVPAVLLALLASLIIGDPGRIDRQRPGCGSSPAP
jgi:hypothetical protein